MKRASTFIRLFAFLTDIAFLACVSVFLFVSGFTGYLIGAGMGYSSSGDFLPLLHSFLAIFKVFAVFLFLFYFTYLTAYGEKTIGKSLFGIAVVRKQDEGEIGYLRSLWRACAYWISAFPFFLGFFVAFLLKGRSLHDILAGTMVTKEG